MTRKKPLNRCYKKRKVKTSTGVFTFHEEEVIKYKAKQICEENGEVLAPLTKHRDRKRIKKALKFDDDECYNFWFGKRFHIGIDFEVYDNEEFYPITTTGEKISSKLEKNFQFVSLIPNNKVIDTSFVPVSPFYDDMRDNMTMVAWGNYIPSNANYSFACLKPAEPKTTCEPLVVDSSFPITLFGGMCFAITTIGLILLIIKHKRRADKLEKLLEASSLRKC